MSKPVVITADQFSALRVASTEILTLMRTHLHSDTLKAGVRVEALVNMLIEIEDRHLDMNKPLGIDENIGSCEPSPLIRWDKTGSVWHTDIGKVGRYSVRRVNRLWTAFLNNNPITSVTPGKDLGVVQRYVEHRIETARAINKAHDDMPFQSPLGAR